MLHCSVSSGICQGGQCWQWHLHVKPAADRQAGCPQCALHKPPAQRAPCPCKQPRKHPAMAVPVRLPQPPAPPAASPPLPRCWQPPWQLPRPSLRSAACGSALRYLGPLPAAAPEPPETPASLQLPVLVLVLALLCWRWQGWEARHFGAVAVAVANGDHDWLARPM